MLTQLEAILTQLRSKGRRKVLDQEPPFRKECGTRGDNLYVVTEVVQLINTTVLQDSSSVKGTGKLSIPWSFYVKQKDNRRIHSRSRSCH
ncbi:GSDMC [Cervus elaphus hippelaphus]|uniref:GSDMC n=1 Tax=Cervus elaphus hippelaphus TaxID=46360 RepID=A0A212CDV6_CEREH|nr:GSDMC [Cervus elaphus hippelaphus]